MKTIELLLLGSLALACSAQPEGAEDETTGSETDLSQLEDEGALLPDDAVLTPPPVDVESLRAARVTAEEMVLLDTYLEESGTGTPTSMEGRIVRWDDTWVSVDELLLWAELVANTKLVEKAYVQTAVANPLSSTAIEFFRPEMQRAYFIIIQDDVPDFVFNAVRDIVAEYVGLRSDDCLFSASFGVTRQSSYDSRSASVKARSFEVQFNFVPNTTPGWPCGNSIACAQFPGGQTISVNVGGVLQSQVLMAIGDVIHFNSNSFPANDVPKLERLLRHELGHTLGLGHMNGAAEFIHLPGTQSCEPFCIEEFESVMKVAGRDSFSADDLKALRTLYFDDPNRANDGCEYVNGFRNLAALP